MMYKYLLLYIKSKEVFISKKNLGHGRSEVNK